MPLDPDLQGRLNKAHPDALSAYAADTPGKATFFWGVDNQTLYTDAKSKSSHNGVMQDHPEILKAILPPEILARLQSGEFKHPRAGSPQAWEVVSVYALMGRLGAAHGSNVVSIWPRSYSGVKYATGELGATSHFQPTEEIPKMLLTMKGQGKAVHYGGDPPAVDDSWVVTMMNEMAPATVGDLLGGVHQGEPPQGVGTPASSPRQEVIQIGGQSFTADDLLHLRSCCHVGAASLSPGLSQKTGVYTKKAAETWLCKSLSPALLAQHPQLASFRPSTCDPGLRPPDTRAGFGAWHQALSRKGIAVHGYGEALDFGTWLAWRAQLSGP